MPKRGREKKMQVQKACPRQSWGMNPLLILAGDHLSLILVKAASRTRGVLMPRLSSPDCERDPVKRNMNTPDAKNEFAQVEAGEIR